MFTSIQTSRANARYIPIFYACSQSPLIDAKLTPFSLDFQVAAQNCRKRKMDLISQLEDQVNNARAQKQSLLAEREELYRLRDEWTHKLLNMETEVLRGLNRKVNDYTFDYSGATVAITRLAKSKA